MTHEQKPESTEFRTRGTITMTTAEYDWVVKDAKARGAAEQRRKDAAGAEPVGYRHSLYYEADDSERTALTESPESFWQVLGEREGVTYTVSPLFARPANVAALEARVKELEAENKAWSSAVNNALTWLENGRKVEARVELKAAQRRAAAIREGGE